MKLSIEDASKRILTDEDFYKAMLTQRAKIYLNGKECKYCIEADEENNYVIKYKEPMKAKYGGFDEEKLYGIVKIVDPLNVDLAEVYLK